MGSSDVPLEPRALERLRRTHGIGEDWEPRFAVDRHVAERRAAEYERMGHEVEIYPHPDDVERGEVPGEHDRCVVYTRRPGGGGDDGDEDGGGLVDDALL